MYKIDMLKGLPKTKRDIAKRGESKTPEIIRIAREYGEEFFDGDRKYGYGGYRYDGRWIPVAKDIVEHYKLKAGDRVLDIGCAKGFLLKDLLQVCPGLIVEGIDVSEYAIEHVEPEVKDFVRVQNATDLSEYSDGYFAAVLAINTIHNLPKEQLLATLKEIQRISSGNAYVQVDSYLTPEGKELFESWVLTAEYHDYPDGWIELFKKAGYTGGYNWTIV
jgi:ubiquinone/menaquinone biosynthesis C-methylase UbiE